VILLTPTQTITVTKVSAAHPVLAAHARAIHRLAKSNTESLAEYILEVGRHLHEARQHITPKPWGHKVWATWLDDEFGWDLKTAFRFIRAYTDALANPIYARNARGELSQRSEPSCEGDGSAA